MAMAITIIILVIVIIINNKDDQNRCLLVPMAAAAAASCAPSRRQCAVKCAVETSTRAVQAGHELGARRWKRHGPLESDFWLADLLITLEPAANYDLVCSPDAAATRLLKPANCVSARYEL